jgi:hypothetical protein
MPRWHTLAHHKKGTETMPATAHRFTERATVPIGRVDKAAGVIHDVRIIGTKSRNRRTYTHDALQVAVGKYEGVHVNANHARSTEMNEDRRIEDWVGVIRNAQYRDGAVYGDLHLRRESKWFAEIVEAASDFPNSFGLSHVADGDSRFDGNEEIVEAIAEVFSVDIVLNPATNRGLFESVDPSVSMGLAVNCDDIVECVGKIVALATKTANVPSELIEGLMELAAAAGAIALNERKHEQQRQRDDAARAKVVINAESVRRPVAAPPEPHEFHAPWMRESLTDLEVERFAHRYRQ